MTTPGRGAAVLAALLALAGVVAGCGGEETSAPPTGVVTLDAEPTVTPAPAPAPVPVEPDASPGRDGPPPVRAAGVAEQSVPGGTVLAVDGESDLAGRWRVDLVRADGVRVAVSTSPDGGQVVEGPVEAATLDDGSDDGFDDGEVAVRVGEVRVFATEALRSAGRTAPGGDVVTLALEEDDGLVWRVALGDGNEVVIDAVTGVSALED